MIVNTPFSTTILEEKIWRLISETTTPGTCTLCPLPCLLTTVPGKIPVLVPNRVLLPAVEILGGVSGVSTLMIKLSNPGIMVSSK